MTVAAIAAALADRDPETLIGPLFYLFTRLVRDGGADAVHAALGDHLLALAVHRDVAAPLRMTAGALALEHCRAAASGG
jgi:hypothetical protein